MPLKVLVVEDSATDRMLIRRYLEAFGFEVYEIERGDETIDWVERLQPEVVLLDIILPGSNGYELCRQLKKRESTQDIPIIFVSAKRLKSDILWGKMQGADDYLTKPFGPEELFMAIERVIGKDQDVEIHE